MGHQLPDMDPGATIDEGGVFTGENRNSHTGIVPHLNVVWIVLGPAGLPLATPAIPVFGLK
jgi:hypothetical protein